MDVLRDAIDHAIARNRERVPGAAGGGRVSAPWLVNALCYDACFRHRPGRDPARARSLRTPSWRLRSG